MRSSRSAHKFATLKLKPAAPRGQEMAAEIAGARPCRGRWRTPTKLRQQKRWLHAPLTRQFPLVSDTSYCSHVDSPVPPIRTILTDKSSLKPWAAASIIFPVSSRVGANQKEMVNLKRTWSRLLNHLCPWPFDTHFAPGNCWGSWSTRQRGAFPTGGASASSANGL